MARKQEQTKEGKRFAELLQSSKYGPSDIASKFGDEVYPQMVNNWGKRNGVPWEHARKVARLLGCKPSEISQTYAAIEKTFDTPKLTDKEESILAAWEWVTPQLIHTMSKISAAMEEGREIKIGDPPIAGAGRTPKPKLK